MNIRIVIGIVLVVVGIRYGFFFLQKPLYYDGQRVVFTTTVFSSPRSSFGKPYLAAKLPYGDTVIIYFDAKKEILIGQTLKISGTLKKRVLENNRILFVMQDPYILYSKPFFLLEKMGELRKSIRDFYFTVLTRDEVSLLLGISFGIKEQMSETLDVQITRSGLLHVIAASGMNVTLLSSFLAMVMGFYIKRQIAIGICCVCIVWYALFSGFEPSIVRASFLGILVFIGQILGRQTQSLYLLFLVCCVMLIVDPAYLFDPGFQLSFLASFGLLYMPSVEWFASVSKKAQKFLLGEDVLTTSIAQVFTFPIIAYHFGRYSWFGILANIAVLWIIPIVMILGILASFFGLWIPFVGSVFLYLSLPFLWFFQTVVGLFPFVETEIEWPLAFVFFYYALLLWGTMYWNKK